MEFGQTLGRYKREAAFVVAVLGLATVTELTSGKVRAGECNQVPATPICDVDKSENTDSANNLIITSALDAPIPTDTATPKPRTHFDGPFSHLSLDQSIPNPSDHLAISSAVSMTPTVTNTATRTATLLSSQNTNHRFTPTRIPTRTATITSTPTITATEVPATPTKRVARASATGIPTRTATTTSLFSH